MNVKARVIAFYLPQFHPIPENNDWWGNGFTEWFNTAKAKPLFIGHHQPNIPTDLGFYDLRLPEARAAQAEMAKNHGIEAFCYYHYWFAGKRLIERPFNEVLKSGEPDFSFCLCWANQTWSGIWHGAPDRILIEQTYPGMEDHKNHSNTSYPMPENKDWWGEGFNTAKAKPLFKGHHQPNIPTDLGFYDLRVPETRAAQAELAKQYWHRSILLLSLLGFWVNV